MIESLNVDEVEVRPKELTFLLQTVNKQNNSWESMSGRHIGSLHLLLLK